LPVLRKTFSFESCFSFDWIAFEQALRSPFSHAHGLSRRYHNVQIWNFANQLPSIARNRPRLFHRSDKILQLDRIPSRRIASSCPEQSSRKRPCVRTYSETNSAFTLFFLWVLSFICGNALRGPNLYYVLIQRETTLRALFQNVFKEVYGARGIGIPGASSFSFPVCLAEARWGPKFFPSKTAFTGFLLVTRPQ